MKSARGAKALAASPRATPVRARTPNDPAFLWQIGWSVAAAAAAGVLLVAVGKASVLALLAMLIIGLPGMIGALWRPRGIEKSVFLGVWALSAAMAATLEGGLGGPLAVWCVMPAIVTIVMEANWICGVGLSVGALLVIAALNALHMTWRIPTHPLSFWLSFVAVVSTAGGAVGGLAVARSRARTSRGEVEAELTAFQSLMGDLPELALAMDADGGTHAVFGRPLPGLDVQALHGGLVACADEADRPKLMTAMREAAETGQAVSTFTPDQPGAAKIAVSFQRTTTGGLVAILRDAPLKPARLPVVEAPPPVAVPVVPVVDPAAEAGIGPWLDMSRKLRVAEAGRKKAEEDAAGRAQFLANMSHELRTPLNAIMGFSDIMRNKMFGDLKPKYAEYAELIHESGRHLMDLINDVLDMSKIEAHRYELSREVFDARDAVNAALRLMRLQADEHGIRLRGVLPPEPLEIDADKRALKQIVLNLVSNALKFTHDGGLITVTAERAAGAFELVVADSGVGIAPEDVARLGRPYEQAGGPNDRVQGTGLGLSLVRSFAELHGGAMNIESRLGEGTAVTVRMPVLLTTPAAEPQPVVESEPVTPVDTPAPVEAVSATAQAEAPAVQEAAAPQPAFPPARFRVVPGGVPEAPEVREM